MSRKIGDTYAFFYFEPCVHMVLHNYEDAKLEDYQWVAKTAIEMMTKALERNDKTELEQMFSVEYE
jgi:hypothetical protein